MRADRTARVNAARLREFGETILIETPPAAAASVTAIRGQRSALDDGDATFEVVWLDASALELPPVERKTKVTVDDVAYVVATPPSKTDPHGLTKLALEKL